MIALLFACTHGSPDTDSTAIVTRDGVTLAADEYPASPGRPAVLLLHMIPPSNDRTNWPADFIATLHAHDWWVLVPDRRGAGDSEGDPQDAYEGEAGRYDVEACVSHLTDQGAGPIAIIGASNGTTSMIDYASWAPAESLPEPVALGFMTGGGYTETNTAMSAVPPLPSIFTYSTDERAWSVAQQPLDPGSWSFHEYEDGAHGTGMFSAAPEVASDLDRFLVDALG